MVNYLPFDADSGWELYEEPENMFHYEAGYKITFEGTTVEIGEGNDRNTSWKFINVISNKFCVGRICGNMSGEKNKENIPYINEKLEILKANRAKFIERLEEKKEEKNASERRKNIIARNTEVKRVRNRIRIE